MSITYRFRPAIHQITPYGGPLPGSGRDLKTTPLDPTEEAALERLKALLPTSQKQLRRQGMAFDRDLLEAWKLFEQGERDVKSGAIQANPHPMPEKSAYCGNWYECIDCKARDGGSAIRLEWNSGPGILAGEAIEYVSPKYNHNRQRDEYFAKTLTVFLGWICPRCERRRVSEKCKAQSEARKSDAEQVDQLLGELIEKESA